MHLSLPSSLRRFFLMRIEVARRFFNTRPAGLSQIAPIMGEGRVIRPRNNGARVPRPTTNRLCRSSAARIP
jgi:hypothetical protein